MDISPWDSRVFSEPYQPFIKEYDSNNNLNEFEKLIHKKMEEIKNNGILVKDQILHYSRYEKITAEYFPFDELYKDFYKIKIVRKSYNDLVLSLCIAHVTNRWHLWEGQYIDLKPVYIDKETFEKCCDIQYHYQKAITETELNFDEVVYYEDLVGDPNKDIKKIKLFSDAEVDRVMVEKNPPSLEMISNKEEVEKWLKNSL
jgi:hypothetical protein